MAIYVKPLSVVILKFRSTAGHWASYETTQDIENKLKKNINIYSLLFNPLSDSTVVHLGDKNVRSTNFH